ncbi:restriction endonuclease subunit S [Polaribacter sp.]|uniref:restriction endonuclease subunit S n=1 Tax=Polaribacter sp. TaxID=1920175 RepID=UPI003F69A31E
MDILNHSWDSMRIKHLFEERVEKNSDSKNDYLSIVKDVGVIPYSEKGNVGNKTSDNPEKYKRVYPDDLVINPMNVTIGSVGISNYSGCLSNVYMVLKPKIEFYPQYYGYLFQIKSFQKSLRKISYGIMEIRESINKIEFFGLELPYPPLSEQQQIVSFLDTKTSLIDSLIEKTQRKIELLKEKRTSLINEVVTKGLNPNVKMKDSGVEWIGEIPSHWKITKMKYGVSHLSEKGKPEKTDIKISPENVESDTGVCFNLYSEHESEGMRFQSGDILLNKLRLYLKKILYTEYDGFSLGEMIVLRTNNKLNNKYFYQLLFSQGLIDLLDSQSTGIKLPRVSPDVILNTKIVYPPLKEQQKIVEYLDEQTGLIDKTISIEEKRTELLKEYRQSLISEVVIGKLKVTTDE